MAITANGVKFPNKRKKGIILLAFLSVLEFILTACLLVTMAGNVLFPEKMEAATGVSKVLSYQGRLTDSSGNPLTGTYYFCFSIYDAVSSGSKLWPSGTPNSMTISVTDGVFNAGIGSGTDDLSTFNFYDNDTIYLNIEVASSNGTCGGAPFETLAPRQTIAAAGYARAARDVYGSLLRTLNASSLVQIGTGSGSGSPIKIGLDVKNTSDTIGGACSPNGTLWYNSVNTRALVCDNGTIQQIGNLATIVGIKEQSSGSTITSGTVNFSAQANITISQDAQTLKFSVANPGGGGGGFRQRAFINLPTYTTLNQLFAATNVATQFVQPIDLAGSISVKTLGFMFDRSTGTTLGMTLNVGIYSLNGATLSLISSTSNRYSLSTTAQWGGTARMFHVTGLSGLELSPGRYWLAMWPQVSPGQPRIWGAASASAPLASGFISAGTNSSVQNASVAIQPGVGTLASSGIQNTIALSNIRGSVSMSVRPFLLITEIP